ncbi:glycosyltransferase [Vagococcus vulneris]|uniref:Glycosyltransferase 2-like domain-containing protein n=1 Tax=Vagococcus vulneris TaxID=1977869 RepID=A0A429ZZU3_9ENTE|nr:glycosyltransferase [Vagococcus vulneris]RST99572.1 hypothetical protein CBF37_04390 [Vagococcus vulneris]
MISVIIPIYNEDEDSLRDSISSILNQSIKELELILILDNPDFKLGKQVMLEFSELDKRVKLIFNDENLGVALSLNRGIEIAKYKYIARLDADDISVSDRLEKQISYLEKHQHISMLSANCILIDDEGLEIGKKSTIPTNPKVIKKLLPVGSTIIHSSVVYRTKVVKSLNGYRKLLSCQDYDLWLRMVDENYEIASLNEYLVKYRIRSNSITGSQSLRLLYTERYVRKLHKERLNNKTDSYSFKNYMEYLDRHDFFDKNKQAKYTNASNLLNNGIEHIKNKRFMMGAKNVLRSHFKDFRIVIREFNIIRYLIYKLYLSIRYRSE